MPKSQWLFERVTTPTTEAMSDLLGTQIEYLTDEENWEEVTLVGFNTHTLTTQAFTMQGHYVEVLPLPETDFSKQWYEANQPMVNSQPAPIKVFHAHRLRMKEVDAEPVTKVIEG